MFLAVLKRVLVLAYELVPESYVLKYRQLRKKGDVTYMVFAYEKQLFDRQAGGQTDGQTDGWICTIVKLA